MTTKARGLQEKQLEERRAREELDRKDEQRRAKERDARERMEQKQAERNTPRGYAAASGRVPPSEPPKPGLHCSDAACVQRDSARGSEGPKRGFPNKEALQGKSVPAKVPLIAMSKLAVQPFDDPKPVCAVRMACRRFLTRVHVISCSMSRRSES